MKNFKKKEIIKKAKSKQKTLPLSSFNNLLFGVNKSINNPKNKSKSINTNKEEKSENISKSENDIKIKDQNEDNINKNKNIIELKNKLQKLQKEINIYAKKTLEELNVTEKIKMNNINEQRNTLNSLKEELQNELNIKYPSIDESEPLVSFEEMQNKLKLRKIFTEIMTKIYNYKYPTPIQSVSIPIIHENKNVIAVSETGSGKTLSYLIPCFHNSLYKKLKNTDNNYKIIIILPTKELAKQIYNESLLFNKYYCENNLVIKYINTSVISAITNDYSNFINKTDVYIATPNNILKLINLCKDDILNKLSYIVFDESDKYFELGFIEYIEQILQQVSKKSNISKIFFSATISENLITIINNNYADSIKIRIGSKNLPSKNIIQEFIYCSNEDGKINELKSIFHRQIDFPVLVFIDGISKIKYIYKKIKYECPSIECMFSKMKKKKEKSKSINLELEIFSFYYAVISFQEELTSKM